MHRFERWSANHRLALAVGFSLLLHGLLLSLHFRFPEASRAARERALDVVLVNRRSARAPEEATVQAQANLDNGGNTEHERRAKTPMPAAPRQQQGDELEHSQKRVQALEAHQQRLATQARSHDSVPATAAREAQPDPVANLSGRDLAQSALAMARLAVLRKNCAMGGGNFRGELRDLRGEIPLGCREQRLVGRGEIAVRKVRTAGVRGSDQRGEGRSHRADLNAKEPPAP